MSNCLGPLNWLSRNCARQQLKKWIADRGWEWQGRKNIDSKGFGGGDNALKWKWQNALGIGSRRKNVRLAYAVWWTGPRCVFNELSNFMITHGHIPTCFYNSNSGYKWNSVRGTWESDSRRESKLCCELQNETAKLKLHKFINSINGVKWVQKVLIEEFYLEHLTKQFLAVSWFWNYFKESET